MDTEEALERALAITEDIVRDLQPSGMDGSTPCAKWSVRQLLNHLLGQMWTFEGRLTGRENRYATDPGALPAEDLIGDDPLGTYREVADALLATARSEEAWDRAGAASGAYIAEVVVHGWDLATATHQELNADGELAAYCFDYVSKGITEQNRAPYFGAVVTVPDNAPTINRLVGFLGREPR